MKVLVIGNGGREHGWPRKRPSRRWLRLFCSGNAGTALETRAAKRCYWRDRYPALLDFAQNEKIDLTIVGPEAPLVKAWSIPSRRRAENLRPNRRCGPTGRLKSVYQRFPGPP